MKNINIVNSCNFFLPEFEQMKKLHISCKNRKRWDGTVVVLASSVHIAAWRKMYLLRPGDSQKSFFDKRLQSFSNAHLA